MTIKQKIAGVTLTALLAGLIPAAPSLANGAASTRNIFLGIGAATYLIIQHNRKVHEKYAADAARQAALSQQRNDAVAAYQAERKAYLQEVAINTDLKREVAYQHNIVLQDRQALAMARIHPSFVTRTVAAAPAVPGQRDPVQVAMVSYGWGSV